jgi:hypothetical protein
LGSTHLDVSRANLRGAFGIVADAGVDQANGGALLIFGEEGT